LLPRIVYCYIVPVSQKYGIKKIYTVASLLKLAGGAMYVLNALPLVLSHLQEFAHLNIKGTGIVLRDNVKN
jgi:hypothetical protein